jgi:hypothetical protein
MMRVSSAEEREKRITYCRTFIPLLLVCFLLALTGCAGFSTASSGPGNTPSDVTVSVSPNSHTLQSGEALQFSTTVKGTNNAGVTWHAHLGTVTSSGFYTAPKVATQTVDIVSANSVADPAKYATAQVVIQSAGEEGAQIAVSVSPSSRTLQSGQSLQFSANVTGTTNTGVTWSAAMGSVTTSGLYTAPQVASQTADTLSAISVADATKYATAQLVIQGGPQKAVWSVKDQQPVTQVFYPGTVWTTPLPADADSHLFANSDAIITNLFGGSDIPNYNSFTLQCLTPAQCTSSAGNGFYYASASDPVFRVNAGSGPCPEGSNATAKNCAGGKYFHLPSGAQYDALPVGSSNDQGINIWDQSTDIDSTPGGRIVSSYYSGTGLRTLPTTCTATTPAQADAQLACQLSWYYNAVNFPFSDPTAIGDGLSSDGSAGGATLLREEEIMQGTVNHAIGLDTACLRSSSGNGVADPPVFPATGNAIGCSFVDSLRPLNGSLFWIDSTYNCSALPAWQAPVCKAMQTYGGYVHATQGGSQSPLYVMPMEGGMAHTWAGVSDSYFNDWIITNGVTSCPSGGYPKVCTGANGLKVVEDSATTSEKIILYFFQMPGLITGHHLHIVDPCIPKRMTGQPGAC